MASEPTTGSTAGWMAAAGWAVAPVLALAMSRSAKGTQRAAWPAITGSTAATPDDMVAVWLRTSWTAREPTMKAPRKPAARVIGLRPAETMLLVKTQTLVSSFSMEKIGVDRY